jgi:hypothetical protein
MSCAGCGAPLPPSLGPKPRKWCSERCRKAQYSRPCRDCGAPVEGSEGRGPNRPERCQSCNARRAAARMSARFYARANRMLALRADGWTNREIAAALGTWESNVSRCLRELRERGAVVPPSPYRTRGRASPARQSAD